MKYDAEGVMRVLEAVFLRVLNTAFSMTFVILFILCLRFLFRRYPKTYAYRLWGIAAAGLLYSAVPFFQTSLKNFFSSEYDGTRELSRMLFGISDFSRAVFPEVPSAGTAAAVQSGPEGMEASYHGISEAAFHLSLWEVLALIWIIGVIVLFLFSAFSYLRVSRSLRFAVRVAGCESQEGRRHAGSKRSFGGCSDHVFESEIVGSPFVHGIWRAKIYVPSGMDAYDRNLILAHERCHIRRRDPLILIFSQIVSMIFWFHPLIWLAKSKLRKDMEMSCDEEAISSLQREDITNYSMLLLSYSVSEQPLGKTAFGPRKSVLAERIHNILNFERRSPVAVMIAAVICLCLTIVYISFAVDTGRPGVISHNPRTGVTVYRDSGGSVVISGLSGPGSAEAEETDSKIEQKRF